MAASPGSGVRSCSSHQSARKRRQRRAHDVRWRDHLPWRARGCYNHVHSYCFALKLTGHSQSDAACRWPGAQVILLGRGSQIGNQRNFGILSTFKYFHAWYCSETDGPCESPTHRKRDARFLVATHRGHTSLHGHAACMLMRSVRSARSARRAPCTSANYPDAEAILRRSILREALGYSIGHGRQTQSTKRRVLKSNLHILFCPKSIATIQSIISVSPKYLKVVYLGKFTTSVSAAVVVLLISYLRILT